MTTADLDTGSLLNVRMFNGFSLSYGGTMITGSGKSNDSQFNHLMQIIIHYRDRGVSREELIRVLFEGRKLVNTTHAVFSVIYNAKKRLEQYGVPWCNYIEQKDGIYYWNPQIGVFEDASRFEELIRQAEKENDQDTRIQLLLQAVRLYSGDFLEDQLSQEWVQQENWRYRRLFASAVEKLAEDLKSCGRYEEMVRIGQRAALVQPFANWEVVTMEAYMHTGQYEKAHQLYEDTVSSYLLQQGVRPDEQMVKMMDALAGRYTHPTGALNEAEKLLREEKRFSGGYKCSFPVFRGLYQAVMRFSQMTGVSAVMMLCTIIDTKGNPLVRGKNFEALSARAEEAIRNGLTEIDVYCRYGDGQFLVMLLNTTLERSSDVQKKINELFMINRQRISISYQVDILRSGEV